MRKEIIINSNPHEIRIAILEDGDLVEVLIERADSRRIVGNLYRGIVSSVKPGLQAAFIDIGMERAGFLHASDLVHEDPESADDVDRPGPPSRGRSRSQKEPKIDQALKVGDEIIVQVTKEPISTKGPRLTADISLPGRFLVHMPLGRHVGVSRKIEERRERVRLKQILQKVRPDHGAFIIRTAASGVEEGPLKKDVEYLSNLWRDIDRNTRDLVAPCELHEDVGMVVGLIRDIFKEDVDELVIDDKDDYKRLVKYVQNFAPDLRSRVRLYNEDLPIFERYGVEAEIRKSTENRVWMKRGGYLIIEQTEALVSIDVNTGRFTGKRNQEETIVETNMIAAREVCRQLRLRDIGGIIVIDFIDMESEGNRKRILNEMRTHLRRDRARTKVFAVSNLGLIEMSRQRVRPSLVSILSDDCPYCKGSGKVLSHETLANRVERELERVVRKTGERQVQIRANPTLALYLIQSRVEQLEELARDLDLVVNVLDDPGLHREAFQLLSLKNDRDLLDAANKSSAVQRGGRTRVSREAAPARNGRSGAPSGTSQGSSDGERPRSRDSGERSRSRRSRGGRRRRTPSRGRPDGRSSSGGEN